MFDAQWWGLVFTLLVFQVIFLRQFGLRSKWHE